METIQTLGQFLPEHHNQSRDAIHIAVMPVEAGEDLKPGQKLRLRYGTNSVVLSGSYNDDYIGRADPFIDDWRIKKGQKFWMWLRPGTITGLRHEWVHPTIDCEQKPLGPSELWLREFAEKWNFDYGEMITEALEKDGYIVARGRDLHDAGELDPGEEDLFWQHIEIITGEKVSEGHKKNFGWSCSC